MLAGIFFVVIGGWLLSRWTYSSSAFGLVNGPCVFWLRLNVTSRKLIICLLASMVMRSPLLCKYGAGTQLFIYTHTHTHTHAHTH